MKLLTKVIIVLAFIVGIAGFVGFFIVRSTPVGTKQAPLSLLKIIFPTNRYEEEIRNLTATAATPEEASRELSTLLTSLESIGFSLPDCLFDLKSPCISHYQLRKELGKTILVALRGGTLDISDFYSLAYGDTERLLLYESISSQDSTDTRKGIDHIWQASQEYSVNPLVVSLFLKLINSTDYTFVKGMAYATAGRLRAYYDLFQRGDEGRMKKLHKSEQAVVGTLLKNTTLSAAEKAVLTFGAVYYDAHFLELFVLRWKSLAELFWLDKNVTLYPSLFSPKQETSLFENATLTPSSPTDFSYCAGGKFQQCMFTGDFMLCRNRAELDAVCLRSTTPIRL